MNQAVTHLLGGSLIALLLSLSSCSSPGGAEPGSGAPETAAGAQDPAPSATRGQDNPATQGQDDVMAQRRRALIDQTLESARHAMSSRLFEDAKRAAAGVLELDPSNEEARRILIDAQTYLGERPTGGGREHMDRVMQAEIEKERTRLQALDLERTADFAVERGEFDDALEAYRRARFMIVYNRFFLPGSEEEKRLDAKIAKALETRERVAREKDEEVAAKSRARLEEEERQARLRREARIRRLFEEANLAFQRQRYVEAINLLETALQDDPNHRSARELLELAQRARHDHDLDELKRRWKSAWNDTFDEIHAADLVQTEAIKFDMARWTEVAQRTPIEFSNTDDTDTPEDREVQRILEERTFVHNFPDSPLEDWTRWYQQATGVNFLVSAKAKEMEPDTTKLTDFSLPRTSVKNALDAISRVTRVQWRVNNGVVHIVSPEERGGRSYLNYYEVRSLISPVPNYPGRDITLRGQGEEEPAEEEEEPVPTVLTGDQLVSLIKDNIAKDTWEGGDNSISEQAGTLVVRQTRDVHAQVRKLLADLRSSTGVQVNIESRFLRVEDNFLEDLGVDFRGLGNQASEGIPGRGLEKQRPRPGVGFDDYGRRENISASAPGEIGTGTEPGMFFDDGNDGDLIGRTENLYDRTLGRGAEGLDNSGGLALQYVYLGDTELEVVLRAVSKQERVEEVTAPQLLLYNAQRGNLSVTNQFSYIKDFEVEIAQAAAVADPVVGVVKDGVVLDVRPVVSADRRFITIELRPTLATLAQPIPTFTTTLGVGQPISIQLPVLTVQKVRTTVTIPDGGTLMLGGMKSSEKQNMNSGVPFLQDIPVVSFLFTRKGSYIANRKVLILLRANILIPAELEPRLVTPDEIPLASAK